MSELGPLLTRLSAATLVCSLILLFIARRGRRIDDHPVCRKCRFDLFGLPPDHPNCPECGRSLTRRRAKRTGNRRRIQWLARLAILLLLCSTGWLGFVGVRRARAVNLNAYKSVAWLIRDTRSERTCGGAFDEINARLAHGKLSDNEVRALLEAALAHQADHSQKWIPPWGEFIEAVRARDRMTQEDWQRYLTHACQHYELDVRPVVRRGAALPVRVRTVAERTASPGSRFEYDAFATFRIRGHPVRPADSVGGLESGPLWRRGPSIPQAEQEVLLDLPRNTFRWLEDGQHKVETVIFVSVWDKVELRRNNPSGYIGGSLEKLAFRTEVPLSKPWTMWTSDQTTVDVRDDADLADAIDASVRVTVHQPWTNELSVRIDAVSPPVDLAFEGFLRIGNWQYPLGWIVLRAGDPTSISLPVFLKPGPAGLLEKADVMLYPNFEAAEYTVDVKQIWGGLVPRYNLEIQHGVPSPIKKQGRSK
jgi:hypothetical protein